MNYNNQLETSPMKNNQSNFIITSSSAINDHHNSKRRISCLNNSNVLSSAYFNHNYTSSLANSTTTTTNESKRQFNIYNLKTNDNVEINQNVDFYNESIFSSHNASSIKSIKSESSRVSFCKGAENEKLKFFNTLKSLFAIFDPECKGSIDVNELEKLCSNRNEILNEVIEFLRNNNNKAKQSTTKLLLQQQQLKNDFHHLIGNNNNHNNNDDNKTTKSSTEHSSYRISSNNVNKQNCTTPKQFIINTDPSFNFLNKFKKRENFNSSQSFQLTNTTPIVGSDTSSNENESTNDKNENDCLAKLVTFEEFVRAAELILDKRKINKQNNHHFDSNQINIHFENISEEQQPYYSNSASTSSTTASSTTSPLSSMSKSRSNHQHQSCDDLTSSQDDNNFSDRSPSHPNSVSATDLSNKTSKISLNLSTNEPNNTTIVPSTAISMSASSGSSNLSASTSASVSSSTSSMNQQQSTTKTLSQAFDEKENSQQSNVNEIKKSAFTVVNGSTRAMSIMSPIKLVNFDLKDCDNMNRVIKIPNNSLNLNNANSYDLGNLIEKENHLLQDGLKDLDQIRELYINQLNENHLKQTNIAKLKHQNLFSIDKMLTNFKQLNDLNMILKDFLNKNKLGKESSKLSSSLISSTANSTDLSDSSYCKKNLNLQLSNNFSTALPNFKVPAPPPATDATSSPAPPCPPPLIAPTRLQLNNATVASSNSTLPKYKEYAEHLDVNLHKSESELDGYLKEKQERIESLQKEKSMLIRKLFEMKSTAANLKLNEKKQQETKTNSGNGDSKHIESLKSQTESQLSPLFSRSSIEQHSAKLSNQIKQFNLKRSPTTSSSFDESLKQANTISRTQYKHQQHKPIYNTSQLYKQQQQQQLTITNENILNVNKSLMNMTSKLV